MSSLEPDQPQAQVPVAVEGDREPQGQLMNSTSGAAYELETSGDGEARQMAVSNDDTADLFGSPEGVPSTTTTTKARILPLTSSKSDDDNSGKIATWTRSKVYRQFYKNCLYQ